MSGDLTIVEQKQVDFYEDAITAVLVQIKGKTVVYVPVRPICTTLGVAWNGQYERIKRDPVLSDLLMSIRVTRTDIEPGTRRPHSSELACLPLDFLSGFLFGISANRVKPELKDRVIRYQRECYRVLAEAFQEGRLTADPTFTELRQADTPAAQAYRMAQAIMQMARQQMLMEARVDDHAQRLERIEATLGDESRTITEAQAAQLSQAVKAVAMALSKESRRNEYGGVYGELYRRFDITSYKLLPAGRFQEAMDWLSEWYAQVTGDSF